MKLRATRIRPPAITPELSRTIGTNINGPSLIKVPAWIPTPLGRYYLYFAHHRGDRIRLAYADSLHGPWRIFEPGALKLSDTACFDHIASPDVHVCNGEKKIRMYFHGPAAGYEQQVSMVALSRDGIRFQPKSEVLGDSYFRVFEWRGEYFAVARQGRLYRSQDGLSGFVPGPWLFAAQAEGSSVRHVAVKIQGSTLYVFHSRIGNCPERIVVSSVDLSPEWTDWKAGDPVDLLKPEMPYEGADLTPVCSRPGAANERLCELRDPAIFTDDGRTYLLYSIAGESGIAIAELTGAEYIDC